MCVARERRKENGRSAETPMRWPVRVENLSRISPSIMLHTFFLCVCVWEFHIAEHLFMPYFISERLMCSHEKHISAFPCNELTKWCYCSVKMTSLKWTKQIDLALTWNSQMKEENADVNVHVHYNLYQSKLYRPPPDRKCLSVYAMPRINNTQKRRYETNKKASIHNKFPLT